MDLDRHTLAVYRAVLLHRDTNTSALAKRLQMPQEQIRACIATLAELSLLTPSWESPGQLRAVRPEIGLEVYLQREQQQLAEHQSRLEQSRAALASLAAEYASQGQAGTLGDSEELCGIDEIRTRLESLARTCRRESLTLHPDASLPEISVQASRPLNQQALERGARFRTIYLESAVRDRTTREHTKWMAEQGTEIRISPTLPMRLLIVDGETAVMAGPRAQERPTALVLHSIPVVQAMRALFESYWQHATPIGRPPAPSNHGLTAQERELLRLLGSGLTDEAAARALGIGVRSERRIVAELMERLNSSSRFEAGVKAARLEWL